MRRALLAALPLAALLVPRAEARTLEVGPDAGLKAPSEAARIAEDGDIVLIAPGEYVDCAVWQASRLSIAAAGAGVVLTDQVCQDKAIFVVNGQDVTVTGLTFARARAIDGNGAGIRAQGGNLTVRDSRFVNNQVAILVAANPAATVVIVNSRFEQNGACADGRCNATLLMNPIARLRVENSLLTASRGGTLVQSAAGSTDLLGSVFEDGKTGRAGLLVDIVQPGSVLMEGNTLQKGPQSTDRAAIALRRGEAPSLRFSGNVLVNDSGRPSILIRDWSAGEPVLQGNHVGAGDAELSSSGSWRNRASMAAHGAVDGARAAAGAVRRGIRGMLPF